MYWMSNFLVSKFPYQNPLIKTQFDIPIEVFYFTLFFKFRKKKQLGMNVFYERKLT